MTTPPVLALPRVEGKITVDRDVCDKKIGYVPLQEQPDGQRKHIGYCSCSLNDAEKHYDTTYLECLGVVRALLLLRTYLEGTGSIIRTDHGPMPCLRNIADATGKPARWRLLLSEIQFEVVHHAGIMHQAAVALSHLKTTGEATSLLEDDVTIGLSIFGPAEDYDEEDLLYAQSVPGKDRGANESGILAAMHTNCDDVLTPTTAGELFEGQKADQICLQSW